MRQYKNRNDDNQRQNHLQQNDTTRQFQRRNIPVMSAPKHQYNTNQTAQLKEGDPKSNDPEKKGKKSIFAPKTLALMKTKYPTAYKYFVETDSFSEWIKNPIVIKALLSNTEYHHASIARDKMKNSGPEDMNRSGQYKDKFLRENQQHIYDVLQNDSQKLTEEDIINAFINPDTKGPEIRIEDKPGISGGVALEWGANGYNEGEDGTNYSTPIELNTHLFEAFEKAEGPENKQAALMNILSIIMHEYVEDFGTDENEFYYDSESEKNFKYNPEEGSYHPDGHIFGAWKAQEDIFGGVRPGIWDNLDGSILDLDFTVAKIAMSSLQAEAEKIRLQKEKTTDEKKKAALAAKEANIKAIIPKIPTE